MILTCHRLAVGARLGVSKPKHLPTVDYTLSDKPAGATASASTPTSCGGSWGATALTTTPTGGAGAGGGAGAASGSSPWGHPLSVSPVAYQGSSPHGFASASPHQPPRSPAGSPPSASSEEEYNVWCRGWCGAPACGYTLPTLRCCGVLSFSTDQVYKARVVWAESGWHAC